MPGLPAAISFDLNPTISSISPTTSEGGGDVALSPIVTNTGATTSNAAQWQVSRFIMPPTGTPAGFGESVAAPNVYYGNGATPISTGINAFPPGQTAIPAPPQQFGELPVGTSVCFGLSVQPIRHDNGNWRHSAPFCVKIAKKPKVQIWGNDLWAGIGLATANATTVQTGTTNKRVGATIYTFGSWSEYGVVSQNNVSGFGSGSAFAGAGISGYTKCAASTLTFTNAGTSTCSDVTPLGSYNASNVLPDVASQFPVVPTTPQFQSIGASATSGIYTSNGNVTIAGGTIPIGRWIVLNMPNSDVTITGNINYATGQVSETRRLPQLIIIARNISIQNSVTTIDAWLIARGQAGNGSINTCNDVAISAPLSSAICSNRLQVNGPVIADRLYLRRTAGSGTGSATGDPAEVFNFRPDAYLWALDYAGKTGRIQTTYTEELPPRF